MHRITIQRIVSKDTMPATVLLKKWAKHVLEKKIAAAELNIRIVDVAEMTTLNENYRHKKGATNVLSFPFDMPDEISDELPMLGDIVICAYVVNQEALAQHKTPTAHWAHMIVHGTLHLLGYDHEVEADANIMEAEEVTILQTLGFKNPYQILDQGASQ